MQRKLIDPVIGTLMPAQDWSRRGFIAATVGSGFAAAVLPVTAQTIKTDSAGLTVGEVSIAAGDFKLPAYRAMPAGKSGLPVVLVVSEIFGVHEHIADVARRFARLGYYAVAPELFVRQGDAKAPLDIPTLMSTIVAKTPDADVMSDLDACVAWAARTGGDPQRLGVTGFCWGGRITWLYTAHNPAVKAGVAWYGRLVNAPTALQPTHPIDVTGKLNAPVLGLYAANDGGIPAAHVEQMQKALAKGSAAAKASRFVVYPGAQHAFFADYRPSYDEKSATDGWRRCLEWLRAHGVA